MKILSTVSLTAGTGRTTLSVTLGHTLSERARTVLVELDPQNTLGLHLGMEPGEARGLAMPGYNQLRAAENLDGTRPNIPYVPFGHSAPKARLALESSLLADDHWLVHRLESLCPAETDYVVLDTPAGRSPWQEQALRASDLAIVVLGADPVSYATLPEMERALAEVQSPNGPRRDCYVINRIDSRRALSRDVRDAFANTLGDQLLPVTLVDDEAVREAIANRQTVAQHAPHSQFLVGVRELAKEVIATLG